MNIRETKKYTVEVEAKTLKENIIRNFSDQLNGYANNTGNLGVLLNQINAFHTVISEIKQNNWAKLFRDGYSAMVLPSDEIEFIENFIYQKETEPLVYVDEIVLRISDGDIFYTIKENDINF